MRGGRASRENERLKTGKACPVPVRRPLHKVKAPFLYLRGRVLIRHIATQIRI